MTVLYERAVPALGKKRSTRMTAIMELLSERGAVELEEISATLGVSASTIRRDLAVLADQRLLMRTHGGAQLMDTHQELPINLRVRAQETKRAIAKAAVRFIPRTPYAVGINGGSTTALVARELGLGGFDQLRIITNSLPVAQLVTSYPAMNITMTGGQLRPESLELVGVLAERSFAAVNLGTAFLGVDGFTTLGATTHDETEASTNRAMVESAQQLIVVADSAKIGRLTMATVATLEQVDVLITDSTTDPQILEQFRQAGVEVVLASA